MQSPAIALLMAVVAVPVYAPFGINLPTVEELRAQKNSTPTIIVGGVAMTAAAAIAYNSIEERIPTTLAP